MEDKPLYHNFVLNKDNCDKEPIHKPLAIQGHGHIMCFDRSENYQLIACSEGIEALFQISKEDLWTKPAQSWLPKDIFTIITKMDAIGFWKTENPISITLFGTSYNLIKHIHHHIKYIEIEPGSDDRVTTYQAIQSVKENFQGIDNLDDLYKEMAVRFKTITGYDRVMVYKFDKDNHGHVIAESKETHLSSFLHHHFPATDIPHMARKLFLKNKSRIIPDIHSENRWLIFNPNIENPAPDIDLTYTQLRAISPIHIEYLQNMGVYATYTAAIIVKEKLWGLIACHHYTPKFISYEMRMISEFTATILAQRINEIEKTIYQFNVHKYRNIEQQFITQFHNQIDIGLQLLESSPDDLNNLCNAEGCAIIIEGTEAKIEGIDLSMETLLSIKNWLVQNHKKAVFATHDLSRDMPEIEIPHGISGMISFCLDSEEVIYLFWFRKCQIQTKVWGGIPTKPYEKKTLPDGTMQLSPRRSYEKWEEQVQNIAIPWNDIEINTIQRIREGLLRKEAERMIEKSKSLKEDFERLAFMASHDLQEPLRTVMNYVNYMEKLMEEPYKTKFIPYFEQARMASNRMKLLISDLLQYSRLGQNTTETWIEVPEILEETKEILSSRIKETQAKIEYGNLPSIKADRLEIRQLFQNLISNALKYRKPDIAPKIKIKAAHADNSFVFFVEDNGIGMNEKYHDKIFGMFKRLHSAYQYEGTGIGLAICKKIVEELNGKIWVKSREGIGSTFCFSIHKSLIQTKDGQEIRPYSLG